MACYDRRILVPYLRDVCSVELLCSHLKNESYQCNHEISSMKKVIDKQIKDPAHPVEEDSSGDGPGAATIFSVGVFIGFMIAISFSIIIGVCVMIYCLLGVTMGISENNEASKRRSEKYAKEMEWYHRVIALNKSERNKQDQFRPLLEQKQKELWVLKARLSDAEKLRTEVYSVNIIPSKYRNVHAAYYLYDYFSTCRENDLDKIIQTLLLDEISQKLDRIIAQNEEILINQRMQLAMQEQQNEMLAQQHRAELEQAARLEQNQELQLDYQNMIAKNQLVTNFFLAADYIRKYR